MDDQLAKLDLLLKAIIIPEEEEEELTPVVDLSTFLKRQREALIFQTLETARKSAFLKFDHMFRHPKNQEWDDIKKKLFQKLRQQGGIGDWTATSISRAFSLRKPQTESISDIQVSPEKIEKYSQVIQHHNDAMKKKNTFDIMAAFHHDQNGISNSWDLLRMAQEQINSSPGIPKPLAAIRGMISFLEIEFRQHMSNTAKMNPQYIHQGSSGTSALQLVRSYITFFFQNKNPATLGIVDFDSENFPIWPQVFYLYRSGYQSEANSLLNSHGKALTAANPVNLRRCKDPFQLAIYSLHNRIQNIPGTQQQQQLALSSHFDFFWYNLSIVNNPTDFDLKLAQFQQTILLLGTKHFNPTGEAPVKYFQALISVQLFAQALAYLSTFHQFVVETVNFAVASVLVGLVPTPPHNYPAGLAMFGSSNSPSDTREWFNLERILMLFFNACLSDDFHSANDLSLPCLEYAVAINSRRLRNNLVAHLFNKSKDVSKILGKYDQNGLRYYGRLYEIIPSPQEISVLLKASSDLAAKEGDIIKAIQFADFGGNHQDSLALLNRAFGRVISLPKATPHRKQIISLGHTVALRWPAYSFSPTPLDLKAKETFDILLSLSRFFDLVEVKDYTSALTLINTLGILPTNSSDWIRLRRVWQNNLLHPSIRINLGKIISSTIRAIDAVIQNQEHIVTYTGSQDQVHNIPTLEAQKHILQGALAVL